MSETERLNQLWHAFVVTVNWSIPHYLDIERLNKFFSVAHLMKRTVGEELIDLYYPEREDGEWQQKNYEWLLGKADDAGELLKTYDKIRSGWQ